MSTKTDSFLEDLEGGLEYNDTEGGVNMFDGDWVESWEERVANSDARKDWEEDQVKVNGKEFKH